VYAALAVAACFLMAMLAATGGHFVPQVVDLYLVAQYARAMAQGHPFHYNPGDSASTGSTSLLFTAVLAVADAVGIRGEGLIAFALLGGTAFYVGSVLLAHRLAGHLGGARESVLAALLVLLGGPAVWGFLYGSDIAAFMFLFLWLTERLVAGSVPGVAAIATLLALTRPEGLPIAILLAAGARWLWPGDRRARLLAVPVLAGGAVLAVFRALTGYWVSTSMADKSLLANYGLADTVALTSEYLVDVMRGVLLGFYPSTAPVGLGRGWAPFYFAPAALLLVILAVAEADEPRGRRLLAWAVVVAVTFALVSPNMFLGFHFNRYLMWAFPTLHVLTAVGLSALTRRLAGADLRVEGRLFYGLAALFVTGGALSTARFAALYGETAGEIARRDLAAAGWIERHLPAGARIANLATSVEYLTGHRSVNLHGVTSPAFFGNSTAEREMGMFEALGRINATERPEYLLTTEATHASLPSLQELVAPPALYRTTSFGDEILLYRMRYDLVGQNRRLFSTRALEQTSGRRKVDELNVGDAVDERAHGYTFDSRAGDLRLHGTVRAAVYPESGERVLDGGRAIFGSEAFTVTARRGAELLVIMRTAPSVDVGLMRPSGSARAGLELTEAGAELWVEGRPYERVHLDPTGAWEEAIFRIGGGALGDSRTRLELRGQYASFYYWFYQPL
jgi:hypothetical protein